LTYPLDQMGCVAVVDDDEAVLDSFRLMLEAAGAEVRTYPSGAALLADPDRPRCLILDHNMPVMTGLELVRRLQAEAENVRAVLVTTAPPPHLVRDALALGIERVLDKPPTEEDILSFVRSCRLQNSRQTDLPR